jgi:translocator protein
MIIVMSTRYPPDTAEVRTRPLALAVAACVGFIVVGSLFPPPQTEGWYDALAKPEFTAPPLLFLLISAGYYLVFGAALYRAQVHVRAGDLRRRAVGLTLGVMAVNEAWNALFVGFESLFLGMLGAAVFALLLAWLWLLFFREDRISFWILSPYAAWALYDLVWAMQLWRMNT